MSTNTDLVLIDDTVCDFVEAWASKFPASRFSGRTVETARLSVGPDEVNELVAAAIVAELRRLAGSDELANLCDPYNGTTGDAVQEWLRNRADEMDPAGGAA